MMRSMYSGVSGLRVHQTKMDVIGNNISNVNTIGFKSQRVTFNEVFSQTLQSANAASDETGRGGRNPMQVGLGVNVSSIDTLMTQGSAQRTDNPFDLMVDGNGFIIVGDTNGKYFTRAGALRVDDVGNLVVPNGMRVQGWKAGADGKTINKGEVTDLKVNSPENKTSEPTATTDTQLVGNLNINDALIDSDKDGKPDGSTTQIAMYDSLGNLYRTNVNLQYDAVAKSWTANLASVSGNDVILTDTTGNKIAVATSGGDALIIGTFIFDEKGELKSTAQGKAVPSGNTIVSFKTPVFDLMTAKKVKADGTVSPDLAGINAVIGTGGQVSVDIKNLTQYSAKQNIDPKTVNGGAAGSLTGYAIGGDGKITASYDNGTTKLLGQIVVAEFENPAGLQKLGDNLFQTTANSGDFDNIGNEGVFQAGVLEMANVDLSREFTEMIVTQRGFQANSKIISSSDEMLQELVNLKR